MSVIYDVARKVDVSVSTVFMLPFLLWQAFRLSKNLSREGIARQVRNWLERSTVIYLVFIG